MFVFRPRSQNLIHTTTPRIRPCQTSHYKINISLYLSPSVTQHKKKMGLGKVVFVLSKLLVIITVAQAQTEAKFKCSKTNTTCRALIDYTHPNATTLGEIKTLFNVKHLLDIVGANNLPSTTTGSHRVGPNERIKIPFNCKCRNGTGLSNNVPVYAVKKGDGLYDIATKAFAGLVTYPQIQVANNITDANLIEVGQKLWIPLPCSCDEVGGVSVVHYAHLVAQGSSVEAIAEEYGTTQETLLSLNGIVDPKTLQAGQVLDVPLRACSSMVKNDSLDFPLLVANATDVYTANGCVKCKCDSANNWTLQCEPSQLKPSNLSVCPLMQCGSSSNLFIGNTTSTDSCNLTTCAYTGYSSHNISADLVTQNVCPAPGGSGGGSSGEASRSTLQGWIWSNLIVAIHIILLFVYLS